MRAEGEARLADCGLGAGMLLLVQQRSDSRAEGDPGRDRLLHAALCGRRLLRLLGRGCALQLSQSLLNEGEASSQIGELGAGHSLGGHGCGGC